MHLWWNLCTSLTCQVSHHRQFRSLLIYSSDIFWRIKFKQEVQLYLQVPMFLQMSKYIACCWCCIPAHITSHAMRRIKKILTVLWASFCFRLISTQTAPLLLCNGTQKSKVVASPALHWTWAYRLALGVCLKETPKHSRNFWSKILSVHNIQHVFIYIKYTWQIILPWTLQKFSKFESHFKFIRQLQHAVTTELVIPEFISIPLRAQTQCHPRSSVKLKISKSKLRSLMSLNVWTSSSIFS